MPRHKSYFALLLIVVVAIGSTLLGLLISRNGGERGRQLAMGQAISGHQVSYSQYPCRRGCVYLPILLTNRGWAEPSRSDVLDEAISVMAKAGVSCKENESTMPVNGARVVIITDHNTFVDHTDARGNALFGATGEPSTVQIEWPVGFLPCPNSRPMVELPTGIGVVQFMALASAYP